MTSTKEENIKTCYCHGEEMTWHRDDTRKNGGRWRCKVKRRNYHAKDNATIGAYVRKRKWELRRLRLRIVKRLQELEYGKQRIS